MNSLVHTIHGLLPREELEVKYVFKETDNSLCVGIEWYFKGEMVRRDASVSILRAGDVTGSQAVI